MFFLNKNFDVIYNKVILSKKECNFIETFILQNENLIKELGPDFYPGTSEDSLTGRYPYFNFLNEQKIYNILVPKFKKIFKKINLIYPISIQCWANIFRYGEGIDWHKHSSKEFKNFISGNIFISGNSLPGTNYIISNNDKNFKNVPGNLTLFRSDIIHRVYPNTNKIPRISLAFDIYENKIFENKKRYVLIN